MILAEDYGNMILPSLADLGELYGISALVCMQIIRPKLNEVLLVRHSSCFHPPIPNANALVPQNVALAKAEQERAASEVEERRLTAKREPNSSCVASPAVSGTTAEQQAKDTAPASEEPPHVAMDALESSAPKPEELQWLPQLAALFDDVKKIAPPGAIEAIG